MLYLVMRFSRKLEIDKRHRLETLHTIDRHRPLQKSYPTEELEIIHAACENFEIFDSIKSTPIKLRSNMTRAKVAFEKGSSQAYGWASTVVRAEPKEVMAYLWDPEGRLAYDKDTLKRETSQVNCERTSPGTPPEPRRHQRERALGAACEGFYGRGVSPPQPPRLPASAAVGLFGLGARFALAKKATSASPVPADTSPHLAHPFPRRARRY
jgi:hypothetical protein